MALSLLYHQHLILSEVEQEAWEQIRENRFRLASTHLSLLPLRVVGRELFWIFCSYMGILVVTLAALLLSDTKRNIAKLEGSQFHPSTVRGPMYEGVSKGPRTILITRRSPVVHEFPAKVCCGGVLWVSVPNGVVGCGSVWLLHVSLYVYCISRLRFSDIGGMAEVGEQRVCIKFCVKLGKTGSETFKNVETGFWWFVHEP